MTTIDLSPDQEVVLEDIEKWRREGTRRQPYLTLGGYAGTGKTTLVSHLAETWKGAAVIAVCGKAAHVLRAKGVADAKTVHSLLYMPLVGARGKVRFFKRSSLPDVETLIVDEASMVDHLLFTDILSFGLPVLFVGDHGQLEPIGTNPNLMMDPVLRLERIHRQAQNNPILRLATAFREGRRVSRWSDPKDRLHILEPSAFWRLLSPDLQVICGFNKTRHAVNKLIRQKRGWASQLIYPGEKLICLRNNRTWNIFNGQQVVVQEIYREGRHTIDLEVTTDDQRTLVIACRREQFGRDLMETFRSQEVALMDYGYCLTAHKAQGSEWDEVLVKEEIGSAWDPRRWRYTVATRAKKRLLYCA